MMKKAFLLLIFTIFLSCGDIDDGNTILPNVPVNFSVNLDLPVYQDLNFNNSSAFISSHGIKGVIIFRLSNTNIVAWDAACPHISPSDCSTMSTNGLKMICPCDKSEFSLLDGSPQSGTKYPAKQYKVTKNGNILTITNF